MREDTGKKRFCDRGKVESNALSHDRRAAEELRAGSEERTGVRYGSTYVVKEHRRCRRATDSE